MIIKIILKTFSERTILMLNLDHKVKLKKYCDKEIWNLLQDLIVFLSLTSECVLMIKPRSELEQ